MVRGGHEELEGMYLKSSSEERSEQRPSHQIRQVVYYTKRQSEGGDSKWLGFPGSWNSHLCWAIRWWFGETPDKMQISQYFCLF